MKLTETNVTKTLNNYEEIKIKCFDLLEEMSYKNISLNKLLFTADTENKQLEIYNLNNKQSYFIPFSYLLDKKGMHTGEYTEKENNSKKLDISRVKKYIKN